MTKFLALMVAGFFGLVLLTTGVSVTISTIGMLITVAAIVILALIWLADRKLNCKEKDHD